MILLFARYLFPAKPHPNHTDFAPGTQPHVRTEHPHPRGDDIVHIALLQITADVLPEQACRQVPRKRLAVMGVPAQVQVHSVPAVPWADGR